MKSYPRSPYDELGGLVYFRRMADKARLHLAGQLREEYVPYLGGYNDPTAFDGRMCRFLRIDYNAFVEQVKKGLNDDQLLVWSMKAGRDPLAWEKETWSTFMRKRGWRDETAGALRQDQQAAEEEGRLAPGWTGPDLPKIATYFDFMDAEEGRSPRFDISMTQTPVTPAVPLPVRPLILPDVRSPHDTLGGIVHLGRMLDKIRVHRSNGLLPDWVRAKGGAANYDGLCCQFLGISYPGVEQQALEGKSDEEILQWVLSTGTPRTAEEIKIWNIFLAKRNWRDQHTHRLYFRLDELGLPYSAVPTMFDYIDLDEGRPVRSLETILPY